MALQHLRSSTADKRPTPAAMSDGQLALNTNLASPGLFFKDSNGDSVKIGPVHVGTTAPNVTPGAGGQAGNSKGEQWLDTSSSRYVFKIWDGTAWRSEDGEFVNTSGDTMTGALGIIAGTAAAPGVFFSGDPNTGIYSPGADQLAVATNGTGRLFIDASGNVGVGTSGTQSSTFHVEGTSRFVASNSALFNGTTGTYSTWLYNGTAVGDIGTGNQVFAGGANTDFALTSRSATALVFGTNTTERLRITSAGLVGIGTISPQQALHVSQSGGNNFAGIRSQNSNTGTGTAGIEFSSDSTYAKSAIGLVRGDANGVGSLVFYNASSTGAANWSTSDERLRITSAGLVGIGTSSPVDKLHVDGRIAVTTDSSTPTTGEAFFYKSASGAVMSGFGATIETGGAGSRQARVSVDSSGNVGINTASPGTKLTVSEPGATDVRVRVGNINATFDYGVESGGTGFVASSQNAPYYFFINNSERARLDSSGRLLVGTSSARSNLFNTTIAPAIQLEGAGIVPSQRFLSVINNYATAGDGGGVMVLGRSKGGTVGSNTVVAADDQLGRFDFQGNDGTDFVTGATIEGYVDGTPGANDMPGRLVFSTTADGASSPTERMRITSVGNFMVGTTTGSVTSGGLFYFSPAATSEPRLLLGHATGTGSGAPYVDFFFNAASIGSITQSGTTAVAYNTTSDYRLKENVTAFTDGIARLHQLKPCRFNFIAESERLVDGFLAHEVQTIVPEAITGEKDEVDADGNPVYQGIDQSKLVPLLTAALQEAIAKIETLEQRLTAAGID